MKERPILFSAPMVRAILQGKKTQTRREVNRLNGLGPVTCFGGSETTGYDFALRDRRDMWNEFREDELLARCPYGVAGDWLWVRERFLPCKAGRLVDGIGDATYVCFVDGSQKYKIGDYFQDSKRHEDCKWPSGAKWRPSIHMPRWASRITMEVVAVRVERLQDITNNDAINEGFDGERWLDSDGSEGRGVEPWEQFRDLWHKINGADSWAANPRVWVVEFRKLEGGAK